MRSHRVATDRLEMQLVESGPEDGIPVVLIHGNLSTGRFFEHLFDGAPSRYRLLAPDMRGFGDTERVPLDATRGLRDWADDTAALLDALGITRAPHLVGWSTGGAAIAAFALERPVASLTFIDPVGPYGFGATKLDGTPHYDDFAGSGGGTGNPEFTARLAAGDTSSEGDTAPRNVLNSSYWNPAHREPPEREEMLLGELLKSVTGDDGYPGDTSTSEHWPGVAPGTRGILNALSPKYCNWSALVDLDPKPPVLWTHGAQDIVVADGSPWELGTLGQLGVVPGWPGEAAFAPQPMIAQIRALLDVYAQRGGRVESELFEGSGHFPRDRRAGALERALLRLPGDARMSYTLRGLVLEDHELQVPLDHADPLGEQITIFAREVAEPEGRGKPFLLYFQGGPGQESPRPTGSPRGPGWLDRALKDFRVLLLDQRGTGRSTPVSGRESADYLRHFRADSIVRDAERLREALGSEPWSVLGQSFGGFCVFSYLSLAPDGLREAFVTGGTPGLGVAVDDVYRATFERMIERNRRYYERFPGDRERVRSLVNRLDTEDVAAAHRRPAHRPAAAHPRQQARHERRRRGAALPDRAAARLARSSCTTSASIWSSRATRSTRCCTRPAGPTAASRTGRLSACAPPSSTSAPSSSPASTSSRGCSRTTPRWRRPARPPTSSPSTAGRGCTTARCWPPTASRPRSRSTPRTSTSSGPSPSRRPRRRAACARG